MSAKDDSFWMSEAFKLAEKAFSLDEVPVGAIVVCFDRIIGKGYNQCESLNDPTAHAEILAITAAANTLDNWSLNECTIYVTCLLYTSPSPRDRTRSRMPSSA